MKKIIKITLIVLGILIVVILFDTLQAKLFNNSPFIKVTENYNGVSLLKKDKGILVYTYVFADGEKVTVYRWEKYDLSIDVLQNSEDNKDEENDEMKNIDVIINNKSYKLVVEDNETVKEFLNLLPQEFSMEELNGNEKYVYMDYSLSTNSINPKHITAGDVMLYGSNCLVIFYKTFDTSYSYTKIGHIEDLPDLGNESVIVKLVK